MLIDCIKQGFPVSWWTQTFKEEKLDAITPLKTMRVNIDQVLLENNLFLMHENTQVKLETKAKNRNQTQNTGYFDSQIYLPSFTTTKQNGT